MTSSGATVFLVDDDPDVRQGLSRLLRSNNWQVASFGSAEEFLQQLPADEAGCVLLDICMPGMSGTELHERLSASGSPLSIIYLTGQSTVPISVHAMKQGAFDFLEKPVEEALLIAALEQAVMQSLSKRASTGLYNDIRARFAHLTAREREVMRHVIAGRLNKQIASDLGIALKTVKVHRGRVMEKMQVRSVAQLVGLCDDAGLRH